MLPIEFNPNVVERLSPEDYAALKRILCSYCALGAPDRFYADRMIFRHYVPNEDDIWDCQAMKLRLARGCVQRAIADPSRELIEE
jgi:hypothetical protein